VSLPSLDSSTLFYLLPTDSVKDPLNFVVTVGAGIYFILKKHRYVYICKNCRTSYSEYALKLKEECGAEEQICP
jgi:hypothetical protein